MIMATAEVRHNKHETKRYEHSDRISVRRKALFPADDDNSSSDLGPMSPLSDTSSSSNFVCNQSQPVLRDTFKCYFSSLKKTINEYTFEKERDHFEESGTSTILQATKSMLSPLYLSPMHGTPLHESPTKNLKTPHDTSSINVNVKVPRIPRKTNLDSSCNDADVPACNMSPIGLVANKCAKLDTSVVKVSKVRTALFPETDLTLPVKRFYPSCKSDENDRPTRERNLETEKMPKKSKLASTYLCNRKVKRAYRFGQINAGVRHKIRKPKQKQVSRAQVLEAALNIIENSSLNDYFEEIKQTQIETALNAPKEDVIDAEEDTSPPIDANNKFFKSTRMRGIVTVSKNIKLQVSKGQMSLIEKTKPKSKQRPQNKIDLDASDLIVCENDELMPNQRIDDILNMLEADKENCQKNETNDRKRKLVDSTSEGAELLLSPTSQMCDMASGLAINSPKRAKLNINKLLDKTTEKSANVFNKTTGIKQQKLFPIFYSSSALPNKVQNKTAVKSINVGDGKQWKAVAKGQMLLDAGQKRFGVTQCLECQIIYHMGDPNDEIMHLNYHNAGQILRFNGWKHENVLATFKNDRIIKVNPNDSKAWWKKINELLEVVNRDLGFYEMKVNTDKSTVFLYIKNKCIAGCLVAEAKSDAYVMLPNVIGIDACSEESYSVKCGISRIWVSQANRKQGIATALLNCLRTNFIFGYILRNEDIALSSPTDLGRIFATNYFKTPNFFVYTS